MIVDHRNVGAAFRRLSLPSAVSMLGDQLLSIVDTIVIGSLGAVALAGATAAISVFVAVAFAIFGLMSGGGIIAAQRIGAADMEGFGRTVRAAFVIPFAAAVGVTMCSVLASGPLVGAMIRGLPSADAAAIYLVLRCAALIPIAFSGTVIVNLGAAGNRTVGVLILGIINAIHVPLVFVLALGWLTHRPFGVVGAGVSTLISECIAAIVACVYVARRPSYRVFAERSIDLRLAMRCANLGLPESVFLFAVMLPDALLVAMLAPFGAVYVAGLRALNVVSDVTFVVPSPLQSAVQTVVGQRLGAGDVEGAQSFFVRARRTATLITIAAAAIFAALAWPEAYLFTLNASAASLAAAPLAVHMATLPLKGWSMVSLAPIRAAGDTRFSMIVGILCSLLVIPVSYLCIRVLHVGLWGVPAGWIFAWTARALVTAWKLRSESWTRSTVLTA